MEREPALRRIEETIGPFIGHHMARASTELQCKKLGFTEAQITVPQLRALLDGIGKGMFVLVGQEKTNHLLKQVEKSLGIEVGAT
ncbi:MAG: hypothetical protein ACRD21_16150 [Vicinamibacteria bacterium]